MSTAPLIPKTDGFKEEAEKAYSAVKSVMDVEHIIMAVVFALVVIMILDAPFLRAFSYTWILAAGLALIGFTHVMTMGEKRSTAWWYSIIWTGLIFLAAYFAKSNIISRAYWSVVFMIVLAVVDICYAAYMFYSKKLEMTRNMLVMRIVGNVLFGGGLVWSLIQAQ